MLVQKPEEIDDCRQRRHLAALIAREGVVAAAGQAGVENVLDILNGGVDSALRGLGKAAVHDLTPEDVLMPPGFARARGVPPTGA